MFYRLLDNGKYRYYEKYFNESEGKWKQVSVTLNSCSVRAHAEARRILADKIERVQEVDVCVSYLKISEILPDWLEIRRAELKESTYWSQYSIILDFEQVFGNMRLVKITNIALQQFFLKRKTYSAAYRTLRKTIVSLFFDYCVNLGYITENPAKKVVLPKNKKTLEDLQRKKQRFLTKEEMGEYLTYLSNYGNNKTLNALIEVMYLTGLRAGEALALQVECIDYDNATLTVKQTMHHRGKSSDYYVTSPKTLSGYRTISINSRVVALLRSLDLDNQSGFLFLNKKGFPYHLSGLNAYLARTFEASGLSKSGVFKLSSHVLRHSHISLLVELNVPLRLIMDRVGHSDEKTTLNIYTHITQTMERSLSEKMESLEFLVTKN